MDAMDAKDEQFTKLQEKTEIKVTPSRNESRSVSKKCPLHTRKNIITFLSLTAVTSSLSLVIGGIAPNQVIAGSEFEVHRQIYTE